MKQSRKPAQPQFIRNIKGKTPENFEKQLKIPGKGSTSHSADFNTTNLVPVNTRRRGGGSLR